MKSNTGSRFILKPGTHYIAKSDNDIEVSFVLSGRENPVDGDQIASGLFVQDGEPTEQPIAVRTLNHIPKDIRFRYIREAAMSFEGINGFLNPYDNISEPLFIGQCLVGPNQMTPVFIRKYIPGIPLNRYIEENGPLSEEMALSFISQIGQALIVAHSNNVIHKCLRPSNIIVANNGERLVVTDFGTGCFLTRDVLMKLTVHDEQVHYLSPEQIRGVIGIDSTTDIFSLGVILYKMLTGSELYLKGSVSRIFAAISKRKAVIEHKCISAYTRSLISKLICIDRKERFQTVADFLCELPPQIRPLRLTRFLGERSFRCYQCKEPNSADARYCNSCGRDFSFQCSACRESIYVNRNFCHHCGEPVTRSSSKAYLIGIRGGYSGTKIDIDERPLRFGRHKDNDVSFAGFDKYVSRFQSRIKYLRNQYWLESGYAAGGKTTNGTFINGTNIDGRGFVLLKNQDKIRMGDSFFRFVC